jgi:hypothetical protein
MRFVPIKTVYQQANLAWHRVRDGWTEERTALLNRGRGCWPNSGSSAVVEVTLGHYE